MSIRRFDSLITDYGRDERAYLFSYLRDDNIPLVIFGDGQVADRVRTVLKEKGIRIDFSVVSDSLYKEHDKRSDLFKWSNIREIGECNLIAGMRDYPFIYAEAIKNSSVKNVFFLDNVFGTEDIELEYFHTRIDDFYRSWLFLEDDLSRNTYLNYLKTAIWHNAKFMFEVFDKGKQYFPLDLFKFTDHETFVNCGSYTGDTIVYFKEATNNMFNRVYAFEPNTDLFKKLSDNIKDSRVLKYNDGVYSSEGFKSFVEEKGSVDGTSRVVENAEDSHRIRIVTIDKTINEPISFVNMDIEGSELEALFGAKESIIKYRPKMAICVYHKKSDLIDIPAFIRSIVPDYKLFLRAYCPWQEELVLYAI